ncbi:holo-ACP synthase [Thiohalobacter sp. IOR34]|uniref:holo-ACP synthase n=1 Tax=Thiohalobacter sp. IOR34 TaxID=3057176 RepID=UPI0025B01B25|nr:holo-ACP synthase [Thiohalobacter sp. IOR34]WJW76144.1 holo-ACP synthase [Thiohalobacter sp. IOR34]
MIYGIGTDLVEVARIEAILERHGRRFAARVLSPAELDDFDASQSPAHFLARRFAVKEAVAKAFGTGFRNGLSLRHIAVRHDPLGRPRIELSGQALAFAEQRDIGEMHVSIADERHYALAFVTLLVGGGG